MLSLSKPEWESKLVQEIAKTGHQVPEKYILKDGFPEAIDEASLWSDDLLIDLSLLSNPSATAEAELTKFRLALSEWGCCQVIGHGIESSFLDELIQVMKQFFELPLEEKYKYSRSDDLFQGYGNDRAYLEKLGIYSSTAPQSLANWNDGLFLTLHPEEQRNFKFWPQNPVGFRGMVEEFSNKLTTINENIYKAMARSLNLEEDCFLINQGRQEKILGKFLMYPRCPCPGQVLGHTRHTDGSTITVILPQKDVQGLEIEKGEQWYRVPVIPGALFINIGDFGEVMSNGVFKSAVHRVIANSTTDRISVVAFCLPEKVDDIGPVSEFVSEKCPQQFSKFHINEYRRIYFEKYGLKSSAIDAFKL